MAGLKVRKNIPIPGEVKRPPGKNMKLLAGMEIGDSIHRPLDMEATLLRFYRVAKQLNVRILIRRVDETDPDGVGVRMWRIE